MTAGLCLKYLNDMLICLDYQRCRLEQEVPLTIPKRGKRVIVDVSNELKPWLERERKRQADNELGSTTMLVMPSGKPWVIDYFRQCWHKVAVAAKIKGLHFHDLRGTFVTNMADAGATSFEIAAITGHDLRSVETILQSYTARTRAQGKAGIAKLNAKRKRKTTNQSTN